MLCMICGEFIGEVSIEGVTAEPGGAAIAPLHYPFTGSQVGSPDPFHQIPAPFDPTIDFEFARCPFGRIHRPIIQDDLVLTHKGMVRLPKDGGPAFLDLMATGEVDRSSIGDRVIQVSDEEAEKQARAQLRDIGGKSATLGMEKGMIVNVPVAGSEGALTPVFVSDEVPEGTVLIVDMKNIQIGFPCPTCGKEFTEEKRLKMHVIGAHKRKKK